MDLPKGNFMELQNYSVNDGDGIRTIIFFAGCPLRCKWCSNPESYTGENKIAYYENTCIKCGKCSAICPLNIGIDLNSNSVREKCNSCGLCTEVCPNHSRKKLIYHYNSEEILRLIERQEIFYRYSGGGVTFSGGEATLQINILRELVNKLYDKAINLTIETSGYFDFEEIEDILKKLDLIFIDIKHMDDEKHNFFTGVSNIKILENIKKLSRLKTPVVVRIPTIEGVNSDEENIRNTAKFIKENLSEAKIELLPYHSFGDTKYESLGMKKTSDYFKRPSQERIYRLEEIIKYEGIYVVSYK